MNIENKKTVLNDEASIYTRTEEVSEKEKWKSLHGRKRWEYFKSYYLMKLVLILLAVGFVGSLIYSILSPKPDMVFYMAIINSAMDREQMGQVQPEFEGRISLDPETQETVFDDGYYFYEREYESIQKFATYNATGQIDVSVMPLSVFEKYGPAGYFARVADKLPTDLYLELSDYLVECGRFDDNGVIVEGSEAVYGIRIDGTWLYEGMELREPVILTIQNASENEENVIEFLRYLFK